MFNVESWSEGCINESYTVTYVILTVLLMFPAARSAIGRSAVNVDQSDAGPRQPRTSRDAQQRQARTAWQTRCCAGSLMLYTVLYKLYSL